MNAYIIFIKNTALGINNAFPHSVFSKSVPKKGENHPMCVWSGAGNNLHDSSRRYDTKIHQHDQGNERALLRAADGRQ